MPPAKSVLTTAAVALVVVVAYEKYGAGKLPKIGR
jgi:hypothetical protein